MYTPTMFIRVVPECVSIYPMCARYPQGQTGVSDALELELQVVEAAKWVQDIKLRSLGLIASRFYPLSYLDGTFFFKHNLLTLKMKKKF